MPTLVDLMISIHATLAGGDGDFTGLRIGDYNFYPRHPRGWRRSAVSQGIANIKFLSTPPSRVATSQGGNGTGTELYISIHATLAGGDHDPRGAF